MSTSAKTPLKLLLYGLEERLQAELSAALAGHFVTTLPVVNTNRCAHALDRLGADILFCASNFTCFDSAKRAVARACKSTPIVVVSRFPEITEWLDAIEGGAADYCAPPFEEKQIAWILETNLERRRLAAA
ncbi:MAG: hypothetical protein IRZ15_03095 [Bryobacteraceae bacterium]|nr:hypothetical protein [Bryobacteraceae bacterium]